MYKRLNVKTETTELLEENIGSKSYFNSVMEIFFGFNTKNKGNKSKNRLNYIKLKSYTAKKTINKMKRLPTKWEKIYASH